VVVFSSKLIGLLLPNLVSYVSVLHMWEVFNWYLYEEFVMVVGWAYYGLRQPKLRLAVPFSSRVNSRSVVIRFSRASSL
jgi:hypothetical protein